MIQTSQSREPLVEFEITVRRATRNDVPGIVRVSKSSIRPNEDVGFGGGGDSPFRDTSKLSSAWIEPNIVNGKEVLVAEMVGHVVGCTTIEDRGADLELINIDVPIELQGKGMGTRMVRSVEDRARNEGKRAVTLGTSRNAEGVAWKSLPWWSIKATRSRMRRRTIGQSQSDRESAKYECEKISRIPLRVKGPSIPFLRRSLIFGL